MLHYHRVFSSLSSSVAKKIASPVFREVQGEKVHSYLSINKIQYSVFYGEFENDKKKVKFALALIWTPDSRTICIKGKTGEHYVIRIQHSEKEWPLQTFS